MTTNCAQCLAEYSTTEWGKLPRIGFSCKDGIDLELRRCSRCQNALARNLQADIREIIEGLKQSMEQHKQTLEQLTHIIGA